MNKQKQKDKWTMCYIDYYSLFLCQCGRLTLNGHLELSTPPPLSGERAFEWTPEINDVTGSRSLSSLRRGVVIVTVLWFLRGLRCLCLIDCGVTLYCSSSTSVLIYCLSVCFGALFSHLFHAPCLSRCKGRAAIPLFKAILYYGSGNSRG